MSTFRQSLVAFLRLPVIRSVSALLLNILILLSIARRMEGKTAAAWTVMQVGGRDGADPVTKWLRARKKVRTIGVEPESTGLDALKKTNAYDFIITQALSDTIGTAPLYITKAKGWCSLLKPDVAAITNIATQRCLTKRPFEIVKTETIAVTTLDTIKDTLPNIDYLQIDVQGAELSVLKGAIATLQSIAMIELEVRFTPIYEQESFFPEIYTFLKEHGFSLCQMTRQGDAEFGENFVESNACFYNMKIRDAKPEKMAALMHYAKAKHVYYGNSMLRVWGDVL